MRESGTGPADRLPGLGTRYLGRQFRLLDEVDSTNNYLKEHAARLGHGAAVIALHQTGGKGRLGRSWQVPRGSSLMMSFLLKDGDAERLTRLPLLVALAVRGALAGLCGVSFDIKWSNDVLCRGGKVCGILCEGRTAATGPPCVVVGLGVNLTQTEEDFARLGLVYASSLYLATGKKYDLFAVGAKILEEMERILEEYRQNGFDPLLDRYRRHCVTLGRTVRVTLGGAVREGRAVDIAADGSLLCEMDGRIVPVSAGEATVRGLQGYADGPGA